MPAIGFIGLGHMGNPMANNLLKAGCDLMVFDLSQQAVDDLVAKGAVAAQSILQVAQQCQTIFTMLQTGEQVSAVCLGDDGLFANMTQGSLYIDCSSIDINTTRNLHLQAKQYQIDMLEAPVSGGVKAAQAAALTLMVGGEQQVFDRAHTTLQHLGKCVIHAGSAGNGQAAKICNNMILGVSMIAVSEGFTLGEKLGLDPKVFFEIASNASSQCWSMTSYCPVPGVLDNVPANNNYQPGFTSAMMLKDLKLSRDASEVAGIDTQMGELATEIYQQFVDSSYADLDFSAIIKRLQDIG